MSPTPPRVNPPEIVPTVQQEVARLAAAPEVRSDLQAFFEKIAPENPDLYQHNDEGPDDMPAHLRAALTQVQLSIPIVGGELALGTWQGIYLFEHRRRPHDRRIVLHVFGE